MQGFALGAVLLVGLTLLLALLRTHVNLVSDALVYLLAVVLVALVGGFWPAVCAAIAGSLLLNYYFVAPLHTFTINEHNNLLALLVFLAVAVLVSLVVDSAARRTREAARSAAESELLSTIAGSVLRGEGSVTSLLERVREAFAMDSATLFERTEDDGRRRSRVASSRHWAGNPCARPDEGDTEVPAGDRLTLVLCGRPLPAQDRRVLGAFAAQAAVALEQSRLTEAAAAAVPLEAANRLRTALLAAVGHDLRTPLASAKAAVTGLRGAGVAYSPTEQAELLAIADSALDRLSRLVDDLLDLSRLQAGALEVTLRPTGLDEVVALALDELGRAGSYGRGGRARRPARRASRTRRWSSGSSPTCCRTRCGTPPARRRG